MRQLIGAYAEAMDRTRDADELTHRLLLKLVRRQVATEAELEAWASRSRGTEELSIILEVICRDEPADRACESAGAVGCAMKATHRPAKGPLVRRAERPFAASG